VKVRSLSRVEARVVLSLEADGAEVVTLPDLRRRGNLTPGFARKTAHQLVRKGWLQPVRRGVYLLNPSQRGPDALPDTDPLRIGSHLVAPYYFGYGTAAQLLGLLPRAGPVYYLVSPVRSRFRPRSPSRFQLIRSKPSRFFGSRTLVRRRATLRVSDLERTVVDVLDRPELSGGLEGAVQVLSNAKPSLNWRRLGRYLERFEARSLALRAGYLLEMVRPDLPIPRAWVEQQRARLTDPWVPLGAPSRFGRRGARDVRWHIIANVSRRELLGELDAR
jgi:predicted transcriptional regulator of viral defense system